VGTKVDMSFHRRSVSTCSDRRHFSLFIFNGGGAQHAFGDDAERDAFVFVFILTYVTSVEKEKNVVQMFQQDQVSEFWSCLRSL
jgi:hypothetical protein